MRPNRRRAQDTATARRPAHALACAALVAAALAPPPPAAAKTPGSTYCFNGVCHKVHSLEATRLLVGKTATVRASYYDDAKHDRYNPSNITSSGEYFRAGKADNAASPVYPDGTKLVVWHPPTRKALTVRVNNAGPYYGDRKLDLSRAAAETLGVIGQGIATLFVRVLEAPSRAEATYRRGRTYPPVKGFMGAFTSLDAAFTSAGGGAVPGTSIAAAAAPVAKPVAVAPVAAGKLARLAVPPQRLAAAIATAERISTKPELPRAASAPAHVEMARDEREAVRGVLAFLSLR